MTTTTRTSFWHKHFSTEAGANISWAAVFAGTITFFAVMLLLSLITSAIGLGAFNPTSSDPLAGVGMGTMIWSVISLLISLFCGGFVAGLAARKTGLLHGFLTWALSLLLMVFLVTTAATSLVGGAASLIGNVIGGAGHAAGAVASGTAEALKPAVDAAVSSIDEQLKQVNPDEVNADVQKVLRDTEVPELQPDYLKGMYQDLQNKVADNAKAVLTGQKNLDAAVDEIAKDMDAKLDTLGNAADKEAISKAVAKNTELSQAEADQTVENVYAQVQKTQQEAKAQVENAKKQLEQLKESTKKAIEDTKQGAEDISNAGAGISVALFFGLLIGLAVCSYAGFLGSSKVAGEPVVQR